MSDLNEAITQNKKRIITTLPNDIKQTKTVIKYEVKKFLRNRRLYGLIIIEALVLLLITILPPLLGNEYPSDADSFINSYAAFVPIFVVIGATLFAGDAIVSEYQNRTGFLLFPTPMKKMTIFAGKFIASTGAMFFVLLIYYGVVLSLGLAITGDISTLGVQSLLLAMLYSLSALSIGYLISATMKGSMGALILTFALFLFIFSIISTALSVGNVDPWFIITHAAQTIQHITEVPYPVGTGSGTIGDGGAPGMPSTAFIPDVNTSIVVMIAYTVASLVLAYVVFKRREMSA